MRGYPRERGEYTISYLLPLSDPFMVVATEAVTVPARVPTTLAEKIDSRITDLP